MMRRLTILSGLVLLAGCGTPPPPPPAPAAARAAEDTPLEGASLTPRDLAVLEAEAQDYRIGAGDVLEIYASDTPEIGRKYVVGPDGQITLPGIGVMRADGMTRTELGKRVEEMLRPLYRAPSVSILVESYNNNRVSVLGEVRKPGQFNFGDRPTIMSALARAEGLTDAADLRGCKIIRGRGTLIEVNLYELLKRGNKALNIPLLPEDTVFVKRDEEHTFYVLGEVARPGVFSQGGGMDVVRAIALAGDATEKGSLSGVKIVRRSAGKAEVITVNVKSVLKGKGSGLGTQVLSGDIVYVPRNGAAKFNYLLEMITPSLNTVLLGATVESLTRRN